MEGEVAGIGLQRRNRDVLQRDDIVAGAVKNRIASLLRRAAQHMREGAEFRRGQIEDAVIGACGDEVMDRVGA